MLLRFVICLLFVAPKMGLDDRKTVDFTATSTRRLVPSVSHKYDVDP